MIISDFLAYILLGIFISLLVLIGVIVRKYFHKNAPEFFCFAERKGKILSSSFSIAASWIWAPALFIATQMAYEKGLAGLFWFLIPNIIAISSFALFGTRIRKLSPQGWNLPEFLGQHFKEKKIENISNIIVVFYQFMAVIVQLVAGSYFLFLFSGIPFWYSIPLLSLGSLLYSYLAGFQGTVKSDVFQYLILLIGSIFILVFFIYSEKTASLNFSGMSGSTHIFDPGIIFSFGLLTSITLFAGALCDQQYWQRSFAIKEKNISSSFLLGGFFFGIIPLLLSFWGFLAAGENISVPENTDTAFIGILTMAEFFPQGLMAVVFCIFLAGLSSTLDSAYSAFSTLLHTDTNISPPTKMLLFASISILMSLLLAFNQVSLKYLWWAFNGVAITLMIPTLSALLLKKIPDGKQVLMGMLSGIFIGVPLFFYGQWKENMTISLIGIILCCNLWGVIRK